MLLTWVYNELNVTQRVIYKKLNLLHSKNDIGFKLENCSSISSRISTNR